MKEINWSKLDSEGVNDVVFIREQESKVAYAYSGGDDAVVKNRIRILREALDKLDITEEEKDEVIKSSRDRIYKSGHGADDEFELFVKILCENLEQDLNRRRETDKIKLAYYDSLNKEDVISLKLGRVILMQHLGVRKSEPNGKRRLLYEDVSVEQSIDLQQQQEELTRKLESQKLVTAGLLSIMNLRDEIKKAQETGQPIDEYMEQIDQILNSLDNKIQLLSEEELQGPSRKVA